MPRSKAKVTTCLLASVLLCWDGAALAAAAKAGVVVEVDGADAPAVSGEIVQALPDNVAAREPGDLTLALTSQGIRGSLVEVLATTKTRKQTLASIHKALTESNAAGILAAQSKRGKTGGHDVRVILIVRSQAEPVIEEDVSTGKGEKLTKGLAPLLAATLQDATATPGPGTQQAMPATSSSKPATPEPWQVSPGLATKTPSQRNTSPRISRPRRSSPVRESSWARAISLTPTTSPGFVRGYGLAGMAMGAVGLEIYPLAPTGNPIAKDIGLVGRFGYALERKSETRDGSQSANTTWTRFAVGARGRIRAGDAADSPVIGLEGTYGQWAFLFSGPDTVVAQTPSVEYKYVRAGADIRVPLGSLSLLGGAGYMYVLSTGLLGERFPHSKVGEVDLRAGAAYGFTPRSKRA